MGTTCHVVVNDKYAGYIIISDMLKDTSVAAIKAMKAAGISKTVMLTGDLKSVADKVAAEALRIGLVNQVVSAEVDEAGNVTKTAQEAVVAAAKKMAAGIAMQAPIAVRNCKKAINDGLQVDMDQAIVIEEKLFGDCFETEDQKAGMGNFLKPKEEKLKVVPFQNK